MAAQAKGHLYMGLYWPTDGFKNKNLVLGTFKNWLIIYLKKNLGCHFHWSQTGSGKAGC